MSLHHLGSRSVDIVDVGSVAGARNAVLDAAGPSVVIRTPRLDVVGGREWAVGAAGVVLAPVLSALQCELGSRALGPVEIAAGEKSPEKTGLRSK